MNDIVDEPASQPTPPLPRFDVPGDWVFTGKALIASKTPWGTIGGAAVAWLLARYGFDLGTDMTNFIAGIGVVIASYVMRYISNEPITGVVRAKPVWMMKRKS